MLSGYSNQPVIKGHSNSNIKRKSNGKCHRDIQTRIGLGCSDFHGSRHGDDVRHVQPRGVGQLPGGGAGGLHVPALAQQER